MTHFGSEALLLKLNLLNDLRPAGLKLGTVHAAESWFAEDTL